MAQNFDKDITLAERYTKALLQSAKDKNVVDKIGAELNEIVSSFNSNPDIEAFFTNPIMKVSEKKDILDKSFKNNIDETLYNFLNVLVDKNRMFILKSVDYLYHQALIKASNILEVEVESVIELDENMNNLLKEKLGKITGKTVVLKHKINKELIGGLMLYFDGNVIDGSVKTQLKNLQMQLI